MSPQAESKPFDEVFGYESVKGISKDGEEVCIERVSGSIEGGEKRDRKLGL